MTNTQNHPTIAIIGAGASGTISALHLMAQLKVPATISLIEKSKEAVGRGVAYGSKLSFQPLNVPVGKMSAFNEQPDDFYSWLKKSRQHTSNDEITKDSFVSRRWYGDYLSEKLAKAIEQSRHIHVEEITGDVDNIHTDRANNVYQLRFSDGRFVNADYIIFATGNEAPTNIFEAEDISKLGEKYVSNPWSADPFSNLDANEDVLILGTGLTMIDHALSLNQKGHQGKIFAFSRHGYLPLMHESISTYNFDVSGKEKKLITLFSRFRHIVAGKQRNVNWQSVLDALRAQTPDIWKSLSVTDKSKFLRRLRPFWEIHRHRMPLSSAKLVDKMKAEGKLKIVAGNFKSIQLKKDKINFAYNSRITGSEDVLSVNRIINCTGPSGDYLKTSNSLVKNLVERGWMKRDDLKLGILTANYGAIITANGKPLRNAYSIGPLRKAAEWESTAIREIRTQAAELASLMQSQISSERSVAVEV